MKIDQRFGKQASILAVSLLVGTLAGPVLADRAGGPGSPLPFGTDRAGDARATGALTASVADPERQQRNRSRSLAAFGTDRAGDALPIGAPPVAAGSATIAAPEERAVSGSLRAAAEQAGDALPVGTPVAASERQEQMAGRKTGDTVN